MKPEQLARQNIDAQLLAAGWIVQDYKGMDMSAGRGIALREVPLTTLAGRLARLDHTLDPVQRQQVTAVSEGRTISQMSATLLRAIDPDAIAERAAGKPGAAPQEVAPEKFEEAKQQLVLEACAPFDKPALRDILATLKQQNEQTIDTVTADVVTDQGFDPAAKKKAATLLASFHDYIEQHKAEITALQILYSRPYRKRLTEPMLKELEKKLREYHAAWTEDRLWDAFAVTAPGKVKGRSQAGRFADLVSLVRFALEKQPVLKPFAESVNERFNEWLMDKAKQSGRAVPALTFENNTVWQKESFDHIVRTPASMEKFRQYICNHGGAQSGSGDPPLIPCLEPTAKQRRDATATFPASVAAGSAPINHFDVEAPTAFLSGDLPHWRQEGTTYFVTFRLADSLPQERLLQWRVERDEWMQGHPEPHNDAARREYDELFPQRLQQWLDAGAGSCALSRPDVKRMVEKTLRHFDGQRYRIHEFVVAPNHVHALVSPTGKHTLSEILHSWKSFTAHEVLKLVKSGSGATPLNQGNKQSRDGSATFFTPDQLAWLNLIRDHIATSLSIEPEDLELAPFNQRGGLGKAHQLFGEHLPKLLDELNQVLAA